MTRIPECVPSRLCAALALLGSAALLFAAEAQSPSRFAANTVREALREQGAAPAVKTVPRTTADLRRVVSSSLNSRLLTEMQTISGSDFQYQFAESDQTAQLGVIVLQYSAPAVAKRMAAILTPNGNYFRNSKILIRFSAIPLDRLLVLVYSENSGDSRIVEAIDNLPRSFEKASGAGSARWSEPECGPASEHP